MKDLIEDEYKKLSKNLTCSGKCNVLNNIIQLKLTDSSLKNYTQHISIDIKQYLNSLILQAEEASIGYDSIEVMKVRELIEDFPLKEKIIYIDYFIRQLQKSSFENEIKSFQTLKVKLIVLDSLSLKNIYKPSKIFNLFINFPLINIYSLLGTFLFISVLINISLLPAPFDLMAFLNFDITYQNLTNNNFINHILNVFGFFVGIENDFKIIPKDSFSMFVYIFIKVLIFIYVSNILINKLNEFLNK